MGSATTFALLVSVILLAGSVVVIVVRWRTAAGTVRHQLEWLAASVVAVVGVAAVGAALWLVAGWPTQPWAGLLLALVAVPAAVIIGRFGSLGRLGPSALVRSVVISGVAVTSIAIYVVVVVGFAQEPGDEDRAIVLLSLLAAVVMALVAGPVARRLNAWARWHVHRGGPNPREALRAFGGHMTRAVPMGELLLQLAEVLKLNLAVSAAEVWTTDGGGDGPDVLVRSVSVPDRGGARVGVGEPEQAVLARSRAQGRAWLSVWVPGLLDGRAADVMVRAIPIAHLGALLGVIVLERPAGSDPFDEHEDAELIDLARQLGLALHNLGLDSALQASLGELERRNTELQASRARLVAASDAARRAIERDLHDGAQQHLVAMAVRVGLLKDQLPPDAESAAVLVDELHGDVKETLAELRILAQGIFPQTLRDRGLVDALRAAALRASLPTTVVLEAGDVGRRAGEVEAAVYFCCLEAIQNACKHAGDAARIEVALGAPGDELHFRVRDDGVGFDASLQPIDGSGLINMADRLGAIGGHLEVSSEVGQGTLVAGRLPVAPEPASGHARVQR